MLLRYSENLYHWNLDLSSNSISSDIANDAFSVISGSLYKLKLLVKQIQLGKIIIWVNKLQQLNHLLLVSTENAFLDFSKILTCFPFKGWTLLISEYFFHHAWFFPNLKSVTVDNNFITNFPAELALHECSNLRILFLSCFETDINSFDERHLNLTLTFLHTLKNNTKQSDFSQTHSLN